MVFKWENGFVLVTFLPSITWNWFYKKGCYFGLNCFTMVTGHLLWTFGRISRLTAAKGTFVGMLLSAAAISFCSGRFCREILLNNVALPGLFLYFRSIYVYAFCVAVFYVFSTLTSVKFSFSLLVFVLSPVLVLFHYGYHTATPLYDVDRLMLEVWCCVDWVGVLLTCVLV